MKEIDMSVEEALAQLDTIKTIGDQVDALEMAIDSLKREIPSCPIIKKQFTRYGLLSKRIEEYGCPRCIKRIAKDQEKRLIRCPYCGQIIKWGE